MKKKFLTILSIVFIGFSFAGCNKTMNNNIVNTPSNITDVSKKDDSYSENITEEISNESKEEVKENNSYEVEDNDKNTITENISEDVNENIDENGNAENIEEDVTLSIDEEEIDTNLTNVSQDEIIDDNEDLESISESFLETPDKDSVAVIEHEDIVEITVKPSTLYTVNEAEIKADAQKNGFISYKINKDGSVTYTMTKETRDNTLDKYKKEVEDAINEILTGENRNKSFTNIEYNENFSDFTIYCDSSKYTVFDSMYALSFKMSGYYYQSFLGIKYDDIIVKVNFVDKDTHKVIYNDIYPK